MVTGVAITKRNRMIQFSIGESILMPYGKLNISIPGHEHNAGSAYNRYIGHPEFKMTDPAITNGVDYHTLTFEHRAINLDTIQAPPGKVVTGIRFHTTKNAMLTIQIRATDFNYRTGDYLKKMGFLLDPLSH